ncbi:MAG: peptidase M64 [Bacteroidetes bacterium]|nr:peptidase M64 [Bacteroidota bacterium]
MSFLKANAAFDDFFLNKTLRVDYFHGGNKDNEYYFLDEYKEEPFWGGSKVNLIDHFNYGNYMFKVFDKSSNTLIYSLGYSTLFTEWQSTDEAKKLSKSFTETIVLPYPKKTVRIEFYSRKNKAQTWNKKFELEVDPTSYFISHERKNQYNPFKVIDNGDPETKLDIVFIPDGYTREQMSDFKKDCERFAGYILNSAPYNEVKNQINIWGVEAPSEESGTDIPGDQIWKKTVANSTFYTFDSERYLMIYDTKTLRDLAANTPYDQIVILVNSDKYGGGGIYNDYATIAAKNSNADFVAIHEFGHSFAGLGDEYYTSDVAVEDFYPSNIEPWEPNLTTLVSFDKKWKSMLAPGTAIPTLVTEESKTKVGVFEGGGYVAKGVYRPMFDCTMKSIQYNNFCPVCKAAIKEMVKYYSK